MKIIPYPETRQVFNFDCGANALVSVLVFAGVEEREDRVALLARTTKISWVRQQIGLIIDEWGRHLAAKAARCVPQLDQTAMKNPEIRHKIGVSPDSP